MSFAADIQRFTMQTDRRLHDVFVRCTEEVQRSVVEGSEITGAPGQPVQTGALRASWIPQFIDRNTWQTSTNLTYAPIIEENQRGATLRSQVGGFHSVAATVAGWVRIVDFANRAVT